jgi:pilus assembly protein FimV
VLRSLIKASGMIAGLIWSGMACAVGFGNANVMSALGQPLKAEIALIDVSNADAPSLTARLASPDAFKAAGLEYPYSLSKLKFEIVTHDGQPYIDVTSKEAVNDPFISLLVEVSWSSGKLQHEYTFLLDPADYKAEQPQAEAVKPIEPIVATTPLPASAPEAAAPEPVEAAASAPAAEEVSTATAAAASAPSAIQATPVPAAAAETKQPEAEKESKVATIRVKRGDTLSKIAAQTKEPDVTLEQMLVALYRVNAKQFDGRNMNRLRAGKILRVPDQAALESLSQTAAVKEIRIQTASWNAYRQKLAAASAPAMAEEPTQEASGKISTSVAEKTPAAKESTKEVLKLSKGEAPGDKTAAGGKAQSLQEEAIAKGKAQQESGNRVAMLEKNVQQMQKLVELKGLPAAPAASAPAAASVAASAPAAAKPVQRKAVVQAPPPPAPSLMDEALGILDDAVDFFTNNLLYLAGLVAFVLAAGLGFFLVRRRGQGQGRVKKKRFDQFAEQVPPEEVAGSEEAAAEPSAEEATSTFAPVAAGGVVSKAAHKREEPEEVDPISEADLFLNFGRDAQAEEILKDALGKNPSNLPIQLKLLSIYANRKDANAFSTVARQIKDSGDAGAWQQAAALGRAIDPTNPVYGGGGAAAAEVLAASGKPSAAPPLDMDIGFNVPMDLDVTSAMPAAETSAVQTMDFDVSGHTAAPMDFDISGSRQNAPEEAEVAAMSFDITGSRPPAVEPQHMDFDVTASHPNVTETQQMDFDVTASHPNVTETQHMDFDVTGGHPNVTETQHMDFDIAASHPDITVPAVPDENLSTVMLNAPMDFDISAPSSAPSEAAPEQPSALDLGAPTFDVTSRPATPPAMDLGLESISLDLGEEVTTLVSPVAEAKKDEQWQEVATKLDLARAYQEMGDAEGAREILGEVLRDGDEQQRESAQALMQQL